MRRGREEEATASRSTHTEREDEEDEEDDEEDEDGEDGEEMERRGKVTVIWGDFLQIDPSLPPYVLSISVTFIILDGGWMIG